MSLEQFLLTADVMTALYITGVIATLYRLKQRTIIGKQIGLLMLISTTFQFGFFVCKEWLSVNPNYSGTAFNIFAFPVYVLTISNAVTKKTALPMITILIAEIFFITNMLFIQRENINSYSHLLFSFIIISLTLYYFFWLIKKLPAHRVQQLPMFWFSVGNLTYFSGALFLFVFTQYLVQVLNNNLILYWSFHNLLAIVHAIFFLYALWVDLKNPLTDQSKKITFSNFSFNYRTFLIIS